MNIADRQSGRRERVLQRLGDEAAMILVATPELHVGRDTELAYTPDPELMYLVGCPEPSTVAVLASGEARFTLFVRPRDPDAELWTGPRCGPEAALDRYGADAAFPVTELAQRLPSLLREAETVYVRESPGGAAMAQLIGRALAEARQGRQRRGRGPRIIADPGVILDELRLIKDENEVAAIRRAADVSTAAFREAARLIRPGAGEWEVQAALESGFLRRRASGPAFPSIVASGENAAVLHYVANDRAMQAGELLLVDAGARMDGYNADISRTFPVSARFTGAQRALYDAVVAAHGAAIVAARPGATEADVHDAAVRQLVQGLLDLGVLQGEGDQLTADAASYRRYYPHRTSHWLGLEVHDVGDYAAAGQPRVLQPGMVLTVEPGLYFRGEPEAGWPAGCAGTGIRVEDDVLVTDGDPEVLTAALPTSADAVAALLGG
jgi:Xaa-Pro aminopeptidase